MICPDCKREVEKTSPYAVFCKDCAARRKSASVIRTRTCKLCGAKFAGGPRAWYCPLCREVRSAEASRRHKRNGPNRKLGSTDKCIVCGSEYTVEGGLQKYCKKCAAEAVMAIDREAALRWSHENKDALTESKKNASAIKKCVVCGAEFVPGSPAVTCSEMCAAEHKKEWQRKADAKRSPRKR